MSLPSPSSAVAPVNTPVNTPVGAPVEELLPLIIGITGHRDLRPEDIEPLRSAVRAVLREVRERYPHTPLVILSPLGEGADRLVAAVAQEEGARLLVPLPLPCENYECSFSSDASRSEFAALLEQAAAVFTLPWLDKASQNAAEGQSVEATQGQIEAQYAAMGAYIARYSHIFLALWDGDDAPEHERIGGTSQVVRFRLHGAPPPYGPVLGALERGGHGAVHHIVTPRQSHPEPAGEPFSRHILPSTESAENFSRIDIFNADVLKWQSAMAQSAHNNADSLVAGEQGNAPWMPPSLKPLLGIYGWSDALSTYFSRQMARTVRRIFILVFLAAFSFNLFHSLPHSSHGSDHEGPAHATEAGVSGEGAPLAEALAAPEKGHLEKGHLEKGHPPAATESHPAPKPDSNHEETAGGERHAALLEAAGAGTHEGGAGTSLWSLLPWFLWLYLGLVALNIAVHQRAEKQELQNKFQDYRALAEGLRVQIFWRLAGLRDEVSDHYLGKQRGELNWIRNAIKSCNVLADAQADGAATDESARLSAVVKQWAQEQRNYYVRKAHREQEELEHQEKLIGSFLAGSIGLALILGLLLTLPSLFSLPFLEPIVSGLEQPLLHSFVMLTIVMLAVIAGLLHGYNQHLARAEHAKRYGRMGITFQDACNQLESHLQAGHHHKARSLLHELGREALVENGDWVLLHRERPLEVPHAG